ncbi:MAG: hypothetical protein WC489_07345 [Patescibacteria group bacterium]|jgi:hypothetical protein
MAKGSKDQIQKFVQILINMAGVKDSQEQSEEFYKTHKEGMKDAKKGAEEASPKIETFLKRWKYELMLVAGAAGAIYALVRYSNVAHTMTDLLARSFGYLADVILIALLPVVIVLAGWIIDVAKAFQELPGWLKNLIGWSIGTVIALEAIAYALKILGITAGTTSFILASLAGLVIGIAVVLTLRELGFFKALGDVIGKGKAAFQNWVEDLQLIWANFCIDFGNKFIDVWNETFARLPGLDPITRMENLDRWDQWAADYEHYLDQRRAGGVGGRTDTGSTGVPSEYERIYEDLTLGRGLSPEEIAEIMRSTGKEAPRFEFVPPGADWNVENNLAKSFLEWGYNYQDEKSKLPTGGVAGLEKAYADLYPNAPSAISTTPPGVTPAPSTAPSAGQEVNITIQHAEFTLDPNAIGNTALMDQITEQINRTNSTKLKGLNTYG